MVKKVHFIGIGGIGMSALARWYKSQGYKVSGSDAEQSVITESLINEGFSVFIGHKPSNVPQNIEQAIITSAIGPTAPGYREYLMAKESGAKVSTYSHALGEVGKKHKLIAVTGAHGKSTTTSLAGLTLLEAGLDPTIIVGTKLQEFGDSNFRHGKSSYLIIEADEHNAAFLNYFPFAAIITNIDREHLDFYKNISEIKKTFLKFIKNIERGGILVVNRDDKHLWSVKHKIEKIAKAANIRVFWYGIKNNGTAVARLKNVLQIPGDHNISNAIAVYTLARALGISDKNIFAAVSKYKGSWRRMEYRGRIELGIKNNELRIKAGRKSVIHDSKFIIHIYDDYAHHPTEIKATISGIAQKWPKMPLICVFQPHQAKRLALLFKEFIGAFDNADALILLDLYKVRGRDIHASYNLDSKALFDAVKNRIEKSHNLKIKTVTHIPFSRQNNLRKILEKIALDYNYDSRNRRKSAIAVMMGAGDIYKLTDQLIK